MNETSILFLEDRYSDRTHLFLRWLPPRVRQVVCVTTAAQAVDLIPRLRPTHVFLDHDLDWIGTWPHAANGMSVVEALPSGLLVSRFVVHSTSQRGGPMTEALRAKGYRADWVPFETKLLATPAATILYG
jgi:hypothetical protein